MKFNSQNQFSTAFSPKDRILEQSKQQKLAKARSLNAQRKHYQAIETYHKVIFLSQKPQYLVEMALIYEKQLMDISSAIMFYRRAFHLKPKNSIQIKEKLKELTKIKGLQLLEMGCCKNILEGSYLEQQKDSDFQLMQSFKKSYPQFHQRLVNTYIRPQINLSVTALSNKTNFIPNSPIKDYLQSCLAYLEVNYRQYATSEIENCLMIEDKNVDLLVLKALMNWSMLQIEKGYKELWEGYKIKKDHPEISLFLRIIKPQVEELYKQAKYNLIQANIDKCNLRTKKALKMNPYHTDLLILKAFLHRQKQEYKQALECLQLANKNVQNQEKESELKSQISLTYNQMAIYLYKQQKYKQAIDLLTEGLKFKENDYGLYTNRGDCYRALNKFVEALEDYLLAYGIEKKSAELNLRISSIYSMRGVSLFNSKNYQLALKQFQQSLKFTPKNQQFIASKAKCLLQLNKKEQAIEILSDALKQNQNYLEINSLLQQIKDPEEKRGPNNRKIIQLKKEKF